MTPGLRRFASRCAPLLAALLLAASGAPAGEGETTLSPGDRVAPFSAEALDGSRREVIYPKGSATVLVFFLSSCPTCHRMIPEWNRAYERRAPGVNVIGVLLDREPPGFFTVTPVAFPVVRSPGREFLKSYGVQHVPVTLRIRAGGVVDEVGQGPLDPIRLGAFFRAAAPAR